MKQSSLPQRQQRGSPDGFGSGGEFCGLMLLGCKPGSYQPWLAWLNEGVWWWNPRMTLKNITYDVSQCILRGNWVIKYNESILKTVYRKNKILIAALIIFLLSVCACVFVHTCCKVRTVSKVSNTVRKLLLSENICGGAHDTITAIWRMRLGLKV